MNRLFSYVTLSLTATFVACVPSKDDATIRRSMTPQDSIISNIALTSFSDKVWTVNMTDSVDMLTICYRFMFVLWRRNGACDIGSISFSRYSHAKEQCQS